MKTIPEPYLDYLCRRKAVFEYIHVIDSDPVAHDTQFVEMGKFRWITRAYRRTINRTFANVLKMQCISEFHIALVRTEQWRSKYIVHCESPSKMLSQTIWKVYFPHRRRCLRLDCNLNVHHRKFIVIFQLFVRRRTVLYARDCMRRSGVEKYIMLSMKNHQTRTER